jgi:MtaA/CmuA family methyltransferase
MSKEMNSMQRWEAAWNHETPDSVPISLFGGIFETHFVPGMDVIKYGSSGLNMAKAHIAFHEAIGTDSIYCLSDMGIIAQGYGTRMQLPTAPDIWMGLGKFPVKAPEDWEKLDVLDPRIDGRMRLYLDTCTICREKYGDTLPIGVSLMSPITSATHVCAMEDVMVHMITEPEALKKGLVALTGTVTAFVNECVNSGASFIGYLTTRASKEITTIDQYREFGAKYDEQVFQHTPSAGHIPHICGVEPMFELVEEWRHKYKNVKAISWWSHGASPNLKQAKDKYPHLTLMSGIDHTNTLVTGSPADVDKEIAQSCKEAMHGGGLVLAPGCEVSPKTSWENMRAAVKAARKHGKY